MRHPTAKTEPPYAKPGRAALRASDEGTRRFAERCASALVPNFFRATSFDMVASSIGVGTYLGDCTDAEDRRYTALIRQALKSGINVVDTAINYRCQRSERAVGAALAQSVAAGEVERDEVLVCTKGGYLPLDGRPLLRRSEYDSYLRREFFDAGVMHPEDVVAGGHSLAPSFLRYSIERSRRNLAVDTLDVYYLHNPEQQLGAVTAAALRPRLRAAFEALEEAVGRRDIGVYGCATWTGLRVPPGTRGHIGLTELFDVAREVAGDGHHFRAVQLPVNLAMPEGIRSPTQPRAGKEAAPALDVAAGLGLTVTVSAPLMQGQLTGGLPDAVHALFPDAGSDAQRALSFVRALPSLTSALVGMRNLDHLADNLASVRHR